MKTKLKEFIDTVFADAEKRAPHNTQVRELKEEMLQNLYDRYDDLVAEGRSPAAAYNIAVTGVGDVSGLLDSVVGGASAAEGGASDTAAGKKPPVRRILTPEEEEEIRSYKRRSAVLTATAVAMYILCWLPLVVLSALAGDEFGGIVGLCVMFLMIAGATAMLIYNDQSKPKGMTAEDDDEDDDDEDEDDDDEPRSPVYKAISAALWILTVVAYLQVSFATGAWHMTWLLFLIATALDNVIKAIFDLRR